MKSARFTYRALAFGLIVTVPMMYTPVSAAPATASLSGAIVSADAQRPMQGVVVRIVNPGTGDLYTSVPTDDKGAFEFEALPAAVYSVAVQQGNGVFTAPSPIVLAPGEHRAVQVALYEQEAAPSPAEAQASPTYKSSGWENPLTATLIALGIAVVVGYAAQEWLGSDQKKTSSSFQP